MLPGRHVEENAVVVGGDDLGLELVTLFWPNAGGPVEGEGGARRRWREGEGDLDESASGGYCGRTCPAVGSVSRRGAAVGVAPQHQPARVVAGVR